MNPMFVAWAAGFFDGEGCVFAALRAAGNTHQAHISLQVILTQTVEEPVQAFGEAFGGRVRTYPPRQPHHRPQWYWRLNGQAAADFLAIVLPYLRVKREVAQLAIALAALRHIDKAKVQPDELAERQRLVANIRSINRRRVA